MKLNHSQLESATVNYESSMDHNVEQKIDAPQSGWIASTVKMYSQKKMPGKVKNYDQQSVDPFFDDLEVAEEDVSIDVNPNMNAYSYGSETFHNSKYRQRPAMAQPVFRFNTLGFNNSPVG